MKKGYIIVTLKFIYKKERWVAYCVELGTAAFGFSIQEVNKKIEKTIVDQITAFRNVEERKKFLEKHEITLHPYKPRADRFKIFLFEPPALNVFFKGLVLYFPI